MLSLGRAQAFKFLLIQLLVGLAFAVSWSLIERPSGLAAGVGASISLLGNAFFVFAMFRHAGARRAQSIAVSLFVGEIGKLIIVVSSFALVFILTRLPVMPLLVAFIAVQSVFWFAPLICKKSAQVNHA